MTRLQFIMSLAAAPFAALLGKRKAAAEENWTMPRPTIGPALAVPSVPPHEGEWTDCFGRKMKLRRYAEITHSKADVTQRLCAIWFIEEGGDWNWYLFENLTNGCSVYYRDFSTITDLVKTAIAGLPAGDLFPYGRWSGGKLLFSRHGLDSPVTVFERGRHVDFEKLLIHQELETYGKSLTT